MTFENELSAEEAQKLLREAPGVILVDKREDGGYVPPVECVGEYAIFVSRARDDSTVDNGIALWCVSDNLRKGAALTAVQIAARSDERRAGIEWVRTCRSRWWSYH